MRTEFLKKASYAVVGTAAVVAAGMGLAGVDPVTKWALENQNGLLLTGGVIGSLGLGFSSLAILPEEQLEACPEDSMGGFLVGAPIGVYLAFLFLYACNGYHPIEKLYQNTSSPDITAESTKIPAP